MKLQTTHTHTHINTHTHTVMHNRGTMHTLNRPFVYFVCIFCYLVIRGCFHVLKLSDLFIKKCYFPVLRLHHL